MEFISNRNALLRRIVCSYAVFMNASFAMGQLDYPTHMDNDSWKMSGNRIRCGLSLKIPNYGMGYFEQYAAHKPHFVLRQLNRVQQPIPVKVLVHSPMWKPNHRSMMIGNMQLNPGEYGLNLKQHGTMKLLSFLFKGQEPAFQYQSAEGFGVKVALTPIGFQKPYALYQKCIGNLLSFDYKQVKESTFHYGADDRSLTDDNKAQLRRIAEYVAADKQIKIIRISGYSDDSGRKGYNNAISQYRAQTVQNYLVTLGVPEEKLSVTWYGPLKPIARNDTDMGRASNRRVEINLIRK